VRTPAYRSFAEPLAIQAEAIPDELAFIYLDDGEQDERRILYSRLHERALGIAHDLRSWACVGDRALLLLAPGLDYVAAIYGCFYAGVIGVSAPPPQPRRLAPTLGRLLAIADNAGISTVISTTDFADAAAAVIPADHLLARVRWLTVDASSPSADTSVIADPDPADVAFLQYTSGSTAQPRGVKLTHANLLDNSRFIYESFGHDPKLSLGFNWIPPFHDMGLIGAILQPVYGGGLSVLASPLAIVKRPARWLQGISRHRATTSGGPNFAYDMCVERIAELELENVDLSCWEVAFNGAEPIRAKTLEAFTARFAANGFQASAFFPCYGLAEATLMVTGPRTRRQPTIQRFDAQALLASRAVLGACADPALVGCGTPNDRHRVEIVDPDTDKPRAPGEVGEIWISGPSVADGYWREDERESRSFRAALAGRPSEGHFLRTGDLGFSHDGELFVVGRLSDLIILQGRNHHPHDIEAVAESFEPLLIAHASAVFELREGDGEPAVALVAESRSNDSQALQKAIATVKSHVAEELAVPLALVAVCERGAVPKTTSGKIQRRLCRSMLLAGELGVVTEWRSPTLLAGEAYAT
jgi:acyl-CoA synthetase (AMP-forming)/AMP-acid ligase II